MALACQRASSAELEQIRRKADKTEQTAEQGGDWAAADQEFHLAIIKASHNEYMRRLYPIINDAVNEIMGLAQNKLYLQEVALADNRMIVDFLLKRDEVGARHAMSIHIKHFINALAGL